jgi:hypothetical protein
MFGFLDGLPAAQFLQRQRGKVGHEPCGVDRAQPGSPCHGPAPRGSPEPSCCRGRTNYPALHVDDARVTGLGQVVGRLGWISVLLVIGAIQIYVAVSP